MLINADLIAFQIVQFVRTQVLKFG